MDGSNHKEAIHAELVRQTLKLAPIGIVATLLNAFLLVVVLWKVVPDLLLIAWLAIALSFALFRYLRLYRYRSASMPTEQAARVSTELVIGLGVSGTIWGCVGIFLFPVASPTHQTLLVFVLCGMVAGAVGAFSSLFKGFIAFTLPALTPITIRFLMIGDDIHYAMSAMTLLYIVLTLFIAKHINTTNRERVGLKEHFALMVQERTAELLHTNEQLNQQIEVRKRAEQALGEAARQWQTTFDAITDSVCLQNTEGVILRCNKATFQLLGKGPEEIIGRKCWHVVHQTETPLDNSPLARTAKTLKRETLELPYDGRHFEVIVDPILSEEGNFTGAVHIMTDITDRKRSEEALKESERKHRTLFETMAQGVIYQNDRGEIVSVNPSAERILGLTFEQMRGLKSTDPRWQPIREDGSVFPGENLPAVVALRTGTEVKDVVMGIHNPVEQQHRWLRVHAIPEFQNGESKPYRVYTTFDDITETKRAEDERRRLERHLRRTHQMEAIATLAGGIAHQFNNALSAIMGNLELLEMDLAPDPETGRYIRPMKASFQRMSHLTSQLLAYAEGGRYQPCEISLNEIVEETLPLIRHTIDSSIRVQLDLARDVDRVEADLTQLQMVLSAIVSNAAEAMEQPGTITLETANRIIERELTENRSGPEPGRYVCLEVRDNGKGMDEKTLSHVFEPFFTTKFQGRGLGMAAAYGIIKNHGGWIGIESKPGDGTVVSIYLPSVGDPVHNPGMPAAGTDHAGPPD